MAFFEFRFLDRNVVHARVQAWMKLAVVSVTVCVMAAVYVAWTASRQSVESYLAIAREAAARLVDRGIPVSSQTVLLRGVNDTPRKMLALLRALSAARIRPYYVFQCDPVDGLVQRFGVPLAKAKEIESYCAERIGGLSLPRFVADLPGSRRKTPIEMLKG